MYTRTKTKNYTHVITDAPSGNSECNFWIEIKHESINGPRDASENNYLFDFVLMKWTTLTIKNFLKFIFDALKQFGINVRETTSLANLYFQIKISVPI